MDSDAASDVSMHTAPSRTPSPSPLPSLVSKDDVNFSNFVQIPMVLDEPEEKPVVSEASADLLSRLPGVYRLLDLVQDQSSGGVVDKIIIAQKSIAAFANTIHPGSYRSDIQVDFKALDEHVIKPRGIYGSASAIVDFLGNVGCADEEVQGLLLRRHIEPTGITSPALRPGLYLVKPENSPSGLVYIVFWPENDTWQDGAISSVARNRVTFMRYLTKLCDQLDCLISDEHSDLLVWKDETAQDLDDDDEYSSFGDRMIGYTVEQTKEEEENVLAEEGFVIRHHLLGEIHYPPRGYPLEGGLDILQPRLIGGEVAQAILGTRYIPEELKPERLDETLKTVTLKDLLSIKKNPVIFLNEFINPESLDILLKHGLWERCGDLQSEWNSRNAKTVKAKEDDRTREMTRRREIVKGERLMLEQGAMFWIVKQVASMYPVVSAHQLFQDQLPSDADLQDAECEMAITKIDSWLDEKRNIRQLLMQVIVDSVQVLSTGTSSRYNMLKRRLLQLINIQNQAGPRLPQLDGQWLAELVTTYSEKVFQDGIDGILNREKKSTGVVGWFFGYGTGSNDTQIKMDKAVGNSKPQDDPSFCKTLEIWARERPESHLATTELRQQIAELLKRKIKALSKKVLGMVEKMLNDAIDQEIWSTFEKRTVKEHEDAWRFLREQVRQRLAYSNDEKNNRVKLTIDSVHQIKQTYGYQQNFSIKGWRSCPKESGFEYTIFPVDIKQDDMLAISSNPDHICKPIIRPRNTQPFFLPTNASMRFIQLLEKDRVLVVVEESGLFRVYLEALDYLSSTIAQGRAIKTIYSEKVGPNPLFALDETRRFFAVLATKDESVQLYVYAYDGNTKSLNARGSAEPLTRWFDRNPKFTQLLFVPKAEELLLIEKSGVCRIFSLVTATFRPSQLRLSSAPESAFSSPDGACLVMKLLETSRPRLLVYHWTSFGLNEGTELPWPAQVPADSPMLVSSVGHRHSNHAIFIIRQQHRCLSICLRISTKSSEFAFRSVADASRSSDAGKKTVNNTLIDCHPEVWTRFPVNAAIVKSTVAKAKHYPRSILFVSRASLDGFAPYFDALIREFEYKTRKPTKNALKQIVVASSSEWISSSPNIETSEFQTGDWLVGLFCLIPIHLAVTRSNRFIPLKDGVDSPTFEHSLLGANVAQISEALSFGWYESIFSSYLANRPVKVVTSMGEQSVGKSFALNHFVDTSFAGSAMRCTEGVWLSVTPTNDYLVVAMDFEGVHSIERSTQEDALLVLLNSAISNFVLFRNNFALSRDITGLFNSFQSCTKVLDPALNPSLFHSTLGIIIKDVIDSDTKEIINEFQQKFQRIVQTERGNNFISKLHRGKLDIIPWPVIESTHFYDLFIGLKKRLDRQPITHKHAGSFLGVLKMLMAKLKANDWGALDQNLAVQRAQHLSAFLPVALAFGTTDPVNEEQLKNYDTDELLDNNDSRAIFFIDGLSHPLNGPLSLDVCLTQLRLGWDLRQERYTMAESEFITGYNGFLRLLVEARIDHVQKWVEVNTSRFREKAEVTTLLRAFDQLSKDLKASVVLCGSKCSSCGLLCLGHKQHDGDDHNCMTDHKCPEPCGFEEQHEEIIGCDLPAGHIGRHVCSGIPHLCGMQCQMFGRNGCLTSCTKPMDHDEVEGHQCAAGMHTCGEQCSLVQTDGTRLCSRLCTLDCRVEHEKHTCDRSLSCPIKCQLCNSYCATGDHFHALEPSAVHLCGQKHNCTQKCELPGVCEINTTPQSIESTFTGKYTSFQYTKYSQEARRLPCIIALDPDQLKHNGPHVHSNDPTPFHYCEERCKYCGYYCTLPLGHSQSGHSTSHGSMAQAEWFVEGDDEIIEVQGRKYATGDNGAPMLCSLLCEALGRHVHVDSCRPDENGDCNGSELAHIDRTGARIQKDWITHRLFWARSGFEDPYSKQKQDEFALCDHRCGGPEHDPETNTGVAPSYCTLPLFHGLPGPADIPPLGHISYDGHAYNCKNPALTQKSFHIYFAYDRSGSMTLSDHCPLLNSPATSRIVSVANNRFGALVSSMYSFWTARGAAIRSGESSGVRRDAYTLIPFATTALTILASDTTSTPDQLLDIVLQPQPSVGWDNDFNDTLRTVHREMERTWSPDRTPVVIFLSDGEDRLTDKVVYDLCRKAVSLGKPLSFHSVLFGQDYGSDTLRRMAKIATEIYDSAPKDPLAPSGIPCSFSSALDTVQLVDTFVNIAASLKNTRAALSRV